MKIEYYLYEEKIYEISNSNVLVPSLGHTIVFDEVFVVTNVIWFPKNELVRVELSEEPKSNRPQLAESNSNNVKLDQVRQAQNTANQALKETVNLKRRLFSLTQYLRTQKK